MTQIGEVVTCPNCGTPFQATSATRTGRDEAYRCPVCQMRFTPSTAGRRHRMASTEDFEASLSSLVELARASGLDTDQILKVLRGELAFAAELAHRGRHLCVQIIDLGPLGEPDSDPFPHDGREVLLSYRPAADPSP